MKATEHCEYTSEIIGTEKKCTLHFDTGVTIDVSNKTEEEVIKNLGHYGWVVVSVKHDGTKKSLFFERHIV